jgi:cytoskeletal protein CcmA (bactofilin family)
MFKNRDKKTSAPAAQDVTVINKGATIEGEVNVSGTIRIYGQLNGTLRSEGKVIIAEQGALNGDLYAGTADVSGTVEGAIEVERLDLRSTAQVEGNVVVKKFTTETGAIFIGDCKMPQNGALPSGTPSPDEAAEESSEETSDAPSEGDLDPAAMEGDTPASDEATEAEDVEDSDELASGEPPVAEPVDAPAGQSVDDGGVKPLPNKPNGEADAEEAAEDTEEAADAQEARSRFW